MIQLASKGKTTVIQTKTTFLAVLRRLPALFIMGVSWYLSSQERVPMPGFQNSDKLVHFVCFGILSASWSLWFSRASWRGAGWSSWKNATLCTLFTSVYGAIDEFHQSFTPGRCAGADDWLADSLGAAIGAAACVLIARLFRKNVQALH